MICHSLRLGLACALLTFPAQAETLRVMSYNIRGGGANEGKGIEETVAAIKAAGADVVGLQETRLESDPCTAEVCPAVGVSVAPAIAKALGWYVYDQTKVNRALWANAVISSFPIGMATENDLGLPLDVNGKTVWIVNIHHDDAPYQPYQPYQLLGIEYGPAPFIKTEAEAVRFANETRGPAMDLLFSDMSVVEGVAAIFLTGDFNEPSGLDWTAAAVRRGISRWW